MTKKKITKRATKKQILKKGNQERELIQLEEPSDVWLIKNPEPSPMKRSCIVRYFQFSEHKEDNRLLNMNVRILCLVTGGVRNITVLAVQKIVRINPSTGIETTSYDPILIDNQAIGDSKDYDCKEDIIRDPFSFPLENLAGYGGFFIKAILTDCCDSVREIISPEFIYV